MEHSPVNIENVINFMHWTVIISIHGHYVTPFHYVLSHLSAAASCVPPLSASADRNQVGNAG